MGQRADWASWLTAVSTEVLALTAVGTLIVAVLATSIALSTLKDAARARRDAEITRHGHLLVDLSRRWDEDAIL